MRPSTLRDAVLQNGLLGDFRFPALLVFLAAVLWLLVLSGSAYAQDDGGAVDDLTNDCTIAPGDIVEGPSPGQYQHDVPDDCFQDFPTSDGNPDGESATADGNSQITDTASEGTVDGRTEVSAVEEETGAGSAAVTSASAAGEVSTLPDTGGGVCILLIACSGVLVLLGVLRIRPSASSVASPSLTVARFTLSSLASSRSVGTFVVPLPLVATSTSTRRRCVSSTHPPPHLAIGSTNLAGPIAAR